MSPDLQKNQANSQSTMNREIFVSSFCLYLWTFSSSVERSPFKRNVIGSTPIRSINKKGWLYVRV